MEQVINYIKSPECIKDIQVCAYEKYIDGCNDSFKNWIDAEYEVQYYYSAIAQCYYTQEMQELLDEKIKYTPSNLNNNQVSKIKNLGLIIVACLFLLMFVIIALVKLNAIQSMSRLN